MARPKQIDDDVLLKLIKKYFEEECNGNAKKLKASDITKYINKNGYPDYPATTLRRTSIAMDYIEELKSQLSNDRYVTLAAYQTINAALLVETNRSKDQLIKAIMERDLYYKTVSESALHYLDQYNTILQLYEDEKQNNELLTAKVNKLEGQIVEYKAEIKEVRANLGVYKSVVEDYIYPEIANELLVREGERRKTKSPLKADAFEYNLITSTTKIQKSETPKTSKELNKSDSNVIKGLFDIFDDIDD